MVMVFVGFVGVRAHLEREGTCQAGQCRIRVRNLFPANIVRLASLSPAGQRIGLGGTDQVGSAPSFAFRNPQSHGKAGLAPTGFRDLFSVSLTIMPCVCKGGKRSDECGSGEPD
jgi:hypothetical protein